MHAHASPCCERSVSDCLPQPSCNTSQGSSQKPGKRETACSVFLSGRTRLEASAMGARAVFALCERSVGTAFACADRPPVWHATLPLVSCPRMRCSRPSRAGWGRRLIPNPPAPRRGDPLPPLSSAPPGLSSPACATASSVSPSPAVAATAPRPPPGAPPPDAAHSLPPTPAGSALHVMLG